MPFDGLEHHPFASRLEADESFLWVGRPDKTVYMQREWQHFRVGVSVGGVVAVASVAGKIYPSDPFQEVFCVFMLIVLPIILALGIYFAQNSYRYAPWYALTDRHLFAATPDEGSFVIHKAELSNIKSITVTETGCEVGTVQCLCYSVIFTLMSRNLRLENINCPKAIIKLILETKCRPTFVS